MATVRVYDQGIIRAIADDGGSWSRGVANEVMQLAIQNCPSASGHLAASHHVEQNRNHGAFAVGFNVYNDARADNGGPLALWVHEGTGIYGPRGTVIVPVNTPERKYMHVPPHMGWVWTHLSQGTRVFKNPGARQVKHNRGPGVADIDPWGHAEQIDGDRGRPWLRRAGEAVAWSHGAV